MVIHLYQWLRWIEILGFVCIFDAKMVYVVTYTYICTWHSQYCELLLLFEIYTGKGGNCDIVFILAVATRVYELFRVKSDDFRQNLRRGL